MSARQNLLSGAVPADGTWVTDSWTLGRLPESAQYLLVQANFVYGGHASTSPSASASASVSASASPSASASFSASRSASVSPSASASPSSSQSPSSSPSATASPSASASPSSSASPSPSPGAQSLDIYVQTTLDGAVTWCDFMQFSFSVFTARRVQAVNLDTALAANVTPTDGTMAPNTILNGLLGNQIRLKYITAGTYRDSTITVDASVR